MRSIDLNADLGEGYGPWRMGDDARMLELVTSASLACGGHASDPETMFATLVAAREKGVVVGAHPGYPDRENFGRRRLPYSAAEIERFVAAQIGALMGVAALTGTRVAYVKAHGALANLAAEDRSIAGAIAAATAAVRGDLVLLAISGTELERAAQERGLAAVSEIYADRGYTAAGQLVPRNRPDAMITDPEAAATRLAAFLQSGRMQTVDGGAIALAAGSICIHGDSDDAVAMAMRVRAAVEAAGWAIRPFAAA
jgi:UPF0271 protein